MKKYIILLISIIIDGLIPNITLYKLNDLSYFTPLCTIVSLIFIYEDKEFIRLLLISSILYGGLYMSNILLTFILFFIVILVIKIFKKVFEDNIFTIIFQILLIVAIYDGFFFIITSLISVNNFNFDNYFYKLTHSIIFNILYGITIFYIYDKKSSKLNH